MKKGIIPITMVLISSLLLLNVDFIIKPVYAITITSYNLTGSTDQTQVIGNIAYLLNDGSGAFRKVNLLTGETLVSTSVSSAGVTFVDFRCNSDNCWFIRGNIGSWMVISRISGTSGAITESRNFTGLQSTFTNSQSFALYTTTVIFARKCTTGDQGSSGSGDNDYALFSIDGMSMSGGNPVQLTDCGANFTPITTTNTIREMKTNSNARLAIFLDSASPAVFRYINLDQQLTTTENTVICSATLSGAEVLRRNGNSVAFIGNTVYIITGTGSDSHRIESVSSICGVTGVSGYTQFETNAVMGIGLDTTRGLLYVGGIDSDATGSIIVGYNFTDNTVTASVLTTAIPSATDNINGFQYSLSRDTAFAFSTSKLYIVEFGGAETDGGANQIDGVCGVGTALECVGNRGSLNNIFYGTGGTNQTIGTITNNLLVGLGIVNSTNTDIKENGTGLFLMLATGSLFSSITIASIAVANNKFNANIQYTQIPKEYWLFLVIGVVAVSYYLQWIPDIIFYSLVVGLAGLFTFGLYRSYQNNG